VPCCFDKDAEFKMGNLQQNTFEEVWHSEPYHSFRSSVLRSRDEIEMCKNCTEGTKVWS
jgi:radical SAM protein with 4Fe4S-binding SPASM domain